jgi:hypothetical protein
VRQNDEIGALILRRCLRDAGTRGIPIKQKRRADFAPRSNQSSITRKSIPLLRLSLIRLAQLSEIELFHFEERLRQARNLLGGAVAHH